MIMERAIGEVFDFDDVKLLVKDTGEKACCDGCYLMSFGIHALGMDAGFT